jgi:predicted nucleic acid-binding protein
MQLVAYAPTHECVRHGNDLAAAGDYLARFHSSHGMGIGDALIAATAYVHDLRLWTGKRKHYPMRDIRHV